MTARNHSWRVHMLQAPERQNGSPAPKFLFFKSLLSGLLSEVPSIGAGRLREVEAPWFPHGLVKYKRDKTA